MKLVNGCILIACRTAVDDSPATPEYLIETAMPAYAVRETPISRCRPDEPHFAVLLIAIDSLITREMPLRRHSLRSLRNPLLRWRTTDSPTPNLRLVLIQRTMMLHIRIALINRLEFPRSRTNTLKTLAGVLATLFAVVPDLLAALARSWMTETGVYVCGCRGADSWCGGLIELVAGIHANWWDFEVVLWFEGPVRWGCACWECFGLEFGDCVVADEDTGCVLCDC